MDWRLASERRFLLRLAIPLSPTTFAQLAITTTDLIYLEVLGAEDLAVAAMAVALYQVVTMFGLGVVTATMPMLAKLRGPARELRGRISRHRAARAVVVALLFALRCARLVAHARTRGRR